MKLLTNAALLSTLAEISLTPQLLMVMAIVNAL
jgi:hypothetical protein